jgi:hypothetical protein
MVSDYLARTDQAVSRGQDRWVVVIHKAGGSHDSALAGFRDRYRSLRAPGFFPAAATRCCFAALQEGVRVKGSVLFGELGKFLGEFVCDRAFGIGESLTCRRGFRCRGSNHSIGIMCTITASVCASFGEPYA